MPTPSPKPEITIAIRETDHLTFRIDLRFFWTKPLPSNAAMAQVYSTMARVCSAAGKTLLIPHIDGLVGQGLGRSSCTVSFETMNGSRLEAVEVDGLLHDVIPAAN